MNRHRLPRGAADSEKDTTDVPVDDTDTSDSGKDTPDSGQELTESGGQELGEPIDEATEDSSDESAADSEPDVTKRAVDWSRVIAYGVLPAVALLLAMAAGYLKWQDNSVRNEETTRIATVQVAKDSTIAMLSYKPDAVEQQLNAARDLLTGEFRESYESLINDVVIPGATQKQISAVASVPAAAAVSAESNEAVVLVFVNQTVVVGTGAPTDTASSVRVTLEKVGDRWLISKFDPV